MNRLYCTVDELLSELDAEGVKAFSEARILDKIRSSSEWITRNIGGFIPLADTRNFDGDGSNELDVDPLLAVTMLTVDGVSIASTEYLLYPLNRLWDGGPYLRLVIDPDATALFSFPRVRNANEIAGRWGLYEDHQATGASVASQEVGATTLTVDNGGLISAGAVLLIEDEQQLVTGREAPTDSTANTNEAFAADDDVLTVTDGTQVKVGEIIRVNFEQMKILDVSGNDLLVIRGWNRTKRAAHLTAQDVYVYRTYTVKRGVNGTTAAEHTAKAVERYHPPADVSWLCRQMAGLMLKKADSGFSGRVGNEATGETFYYSEFPKGVIENVKNNYFVPRL